MEQQYIVDCSTIMGDDKNKDDGDVYDDDDVEDVPCYTSTLYISSKASSFPMIDTHPSFSS